MFKMYVLIPHKKNLVSITVFSLILRWAVHVNYYNASKSYKAKHNKKRKAYQMAMRHTVLQGRGRPKNINAYNWSCEVKCHNASRRMVIPHLPHTTSYKWLYRINALPPQYVETKTFLFTKHLFLKLFTVCFNILLTINKSSCSYSCLDIQRCVVWSKCIYFLECSEVYRLVQYSKSTLKMQALHSYKAV